MYIRDVKEKDIKDIVRIYAYYVENTAVSFEYIPPTEEEMKERINTITKRYPYVVVVDEGEVKGFAYANTLRGRPAYNHCVELTIYLDHTSKRKGYGRALYQAIEEKLDTSITNMYACIADPIGEDPYCTQDSEHFHERMGFKKVGTFHKSGYKFNRYYHVIWMEKIKEDA